MSRPEAAPSGGARDVAAEAAGGAPEADVVVVEAATARKALEEVNARFGSRADILGASKVLRGGIGGFFAREMIQLRVRAGSGRGVAGGGAAACGGGGAAASGGGGPVAGGGGSLAEAVSHEALGSRDEAEAAGPAERAPAVARLLSNLTGRVDDRERTFAKALREQLAASQPVREPAPEVEAPAAGEASAVEPREVDEPEPMASRQPLAPAPVAASAVADSAAAANSPPRVIPAAVATAPPRHRGAAPHAEMGLETPGASEPVIADPSPAVPLSAPAAGSRGAAGVARGATWDPAALSSLELPSLILDALVGVEGDMEGLQAVASAVVSLCRPLPSGASLLAGPHAGGLSPSLTVPQVVPPGPLPGVGPAAAAVGAESGEWLERHRGERWLHLVVGGPDWEGLRVADPLAVSWTAEGDLPAALRLAADAGLVLGYDGSRGVRRATPVDVAVALRELVVAA